MDKIIPGSVVINNLHDDKLGNIMDENNNIVGIIDYNTGDINPINIHINPETGKPYFNIKIDLAED